jgi:hypothetical protein
LNSANLPCVYSKSPFNSREEIGRAVKEKSTPLDVCLPTS